MAATDQLPEPNRALAPREPSIHGPRDIANASTKNEARARDPEMSSTKKGDTWYFGSEEDQKGRQWRVFPANAHVGVDADSGIVHSLETTTAKVHDSQVRDALPHGAERSVWADKGYVSATREAAFSGPGKFWGVMRKAPKGGALHPVDEDINRIIAMVRARVEHPFRVLKRQFGYLKTRYRGLAKNRAQLFTLFALGNLFFVRRRLLA
ncbi:IS5 family transposase [Rhodovulum sp. 12E13]|uniref:IS5 family transposase n=1 Tax=Rhodovulum sp. 12E13 TaxID=2203891 RepID=UPI001F3B88BC|nr:IS5 family transposase [Rhodovulum sp. 12E13]